MRSSSALALALGSLALAACDIPTEAPILEPRWRFAVNVPQVAASRTLGEMCPACVPLNGLVAPAPAFSSTITTTSSLPGQVSGANLAAGTVVINLFNSMSYDPLASAGSSATIVVSDGAGGRELGRVVVTSLPSNQTTARTLTLATGAIGTSLVATTTIVSNGGPATSINTSQGITVTAIPTGIQASTAQVSVAGKAVS